MRHYTFLLVLAATLVSGMLRAQVPQLVNYQGRVAVDAVNFEGAGQFKFALVNSDGTITFWSNDGTSAGGNEPAAAVTLTVAKGLYSLLLGDIALGNMTPIPASVFTNPDVRLRVWFDDGTNGSQLLSPDQRLAPAAYLADGTVTTASIANGAVTGSNIAPASIDGTNIAPGSLDFTHLTVPVPPGAGQVLGFDGNTLNWVAPGAGDGIWALNGTKAFYNGGNVGIGTSTPGLPLSVRTASSVYGIEQTDGTIRLATFLGGSAGGGWLGTISNDKLNFFINNGGARMTVDTTGNVGVGTITPASKFTVFTPTGGVLKVGMEHTDGTVRLGTYAEPGNGGWLGTISNHPLNFFVNNGLPSMTIDASGTSITSGLGTFTVGSPNAESGSSIKRGNNRADVRFDGTTLKLVAGPGSGPPPSTFGVAVNTAGNVGIGTASPQAKLDVVGTTRTSVLAITGGVDLAEPFQMKEDELEKGSVVVIDDEHPGRLKRSRNAYDRRVAGIVSGANGINPGISLHQEGVVEGGQNVALSGRVYVRADASSGPIQPGDMLTTSDTPGYAMKVRDSRRAQGAVIGKAMSPLGKGQGMVLVLVTLQ
jgi:hypothetical protein